MGLDSCKTKTWFTAIFGFLNFFLFSVFFVFVVKEGEGEGEGEGERE